MRCFSSAAAAGFDAVDAGSASRNVVLASTPSAPAVAVASFADAVAVVVDDRALGHERALLIERLLHRLAGVRERFPHRQPAVLVAVRRRQLVERLDEVLRETSCRSFCAAESVAAITMRFLADRSCTNGKLELVVLTKTTRAAMPSSAGFHSRVSMSGPTRLNFATVPSEVPCPMSTTISVSSAVTRWLERRQRAQSRPLAWQRRRRRRSRSTPRCDRRQTPRRLLQRRLERRHPLLLVRREFLAARHTRHDQREALVGAAPTAHWPRQRRQRSTARRRAGECHVAMSSGHQLQQQILRARIARRHFHSRKRFLLACALSPVAM